MSNKLIECVPNVSVGQDSAAIKLLEKTIREVPSVNLLHKDVGFGANRTVFTFVGKPHAVSEAAFQLIAAASELINMEKHTGAHPRIGATDVCPFVPLINSEMDECVDLAHTLGQRVCTQLNIPVFFYEYAAKIPERKELFQVRKGEYQNLWTREDLPDLVPAVPKFSAGATIIGARDLLIAFNLTLSKEAKIEDAKKIARLIRTSSYSDESLAACRAIGWYIPEYDRCQVSCNLYAFKKTSLKDVFAAVSNLAAALKFEVESTELIGMVPLKALEKDFGKSFSAQAVCDSLRLKLNAEQLKKRILNPLV
jgi:glutamate formiminotransferase